MGRGDAGFWPLNGNRCRFNSPQQGSRESFAQILTGEKYGANGEKIGKKGKGRGRGEKIGTFIGRSVKRAPGFDFEPGKRVETTGIRESQTEFHRADA